MKNLREPLDTNSDDEVTAEEQGDDDGSGSPPPTTPGDTELVIFFKEHSPLPIVSVNSYSEKGSGVWEI